MLFVLDGAVLEEGEERRADLSDDFGQHLVSRSYHVPLHELHLEVRSVEHQESDLQPVFFALLLVRKHRRQLIVLASADVQLAVQSALREVCGEEARRLELAAAAQVEVRAGPEAARAVDLLGPKPVS